MTARLSKLTAAAIVVLAGVTFVPLGLEANHAWGTFHWERTDDAVNVKIGDNVSALWTGHLDTAVDDWDLSGVLSLNIVNGSTDPQICRAKKGRIEVCSYAYGPTGWLGIAKIGVQGDHIVQALAAVNDYYFVLLGPLYGLDTAEWRQSVMCQEIGHGFGLDHQDEIFDNPNLGTCMDYSNDPAGIDPFYGLANTAPDFHDYEQLEIITDLHSGGGGGGGGRGNGRGNAGALPDLPQAAFGQMAIDGPENWGRLVRASNRAAMFERDFGNDNVVFTFVIWAPQ